MMRLRDAILDILYPRGCVCALCGREAHTQNEVCQECSGAVRACGRQAPIAGTRGFHAGIYYTPIVRSALHRFKYERQTYLADFFASHMSIPEDWRIDAIVPVPLHKTRLRERGFNQSELLCRSLSARYGVSVRTDILSRAKPTETQTALNRAERAKNVESAFCARNCTGLALLLIDDIRTTGSTLFACANALTLAGASDVYAMTAILRERTEETI